MMEARPAQAGWAQRVTSAPRSIFCPIFPCGRKTKRWE
jgi:hypothetical protein